MKLFRIASVVGLASLVVPLSAVSASAADGSYVGGLVTLNASAGQTDLGLVVSVFDYGSGPTLSVTDYRGALAFSGCVSQDDDDAVCPNTPVSGVRVNGGAAGGYIDVSTLVPGPIDIVSGALGMHITASGPGNTVNVTGGNGPDDVEVGDAAAMGPVSVTGGAGDDSVSYIPEPGSPSFVTDLGSGADTGYLAGTIGGAQISLGSEDDEFVSNATSPVPIRVAGGSGDDFLASMSGPVLLLGGSGKDVFEPDKNQRPPLSGGLPAEPSGGDVVRGGSGKDTLRLDSPGRTKKVKISLDGKANDGQRGEKDNYGKDLEVIEVVYVEATVTGSKANNVIDLDGGVSRGKDGNDTLTGGDRQFGGAGKDKIFGGTLIDGGSGKDKLVGYSDTQRIMARDGERDFITCEEGPTVVYADRLDIVEPGDCAKVIRR